MTTRKLRKQLEELHDAIAGADKLDEEGRRLLRDLDEHIRALLARSDDAVMQPRPGMTRGLEDAVRHFEVTHPALTSALSDLLTALSNAGI
jgi:predicted component of type VI protein secretion system